MFCISQGFKGLDIYRKIAVNTTRRNNKGRAIAEKKAQGLVFVLEHTGFGVRGWLMVRPIPDGQ
jgi:hypothetical protein